MTSATAFTGAVLTGGASTRMGRDKALIEIGGRPLVTVAVDALGAAGATEVLTIGGDRAALAALGLDARPDDHPGQGPLGGLLTALRLAANEVVVVLACDMPGVDGAVGRALIDALAGAPDADVAAAVADGRLQTLTAAYRRRAQAPLARSFADGERSVRRALGELVVVRVLRLDGDALADVDRPEELRRYAQPP